MNCANHPETAAVAYCRNCGKALCGNCQRPVRGSVYCEEHVPPEPAASAPGASPYTSPYTSPGPAAANAPEHASPAAAFWLGMIPGVGAIYNGQYAKGLLHVVIVGLLISILGSDAAAGFEPLFGLLLAVFWFYMAFEAYHTAKRRKAGLPVNEFSSLVPRRGTGFPTGPILLIALGVVFLLNNLGVLHLHDLLKYWPVFLIALGVYLLWERMVESHRAAGAREQEAAHERH